MNATDSFLSQLATADAPAGTAPALVHLQDVHLSFGDN